MKTIQRLACLAVLVVGLVGLIPSNASGTIYKDLCSDLDNLDNTHLPALQKLIMKPTATPQDYLPYLSSLQTASSVKLFSGTSKSPISTYVMDTCFSVTENSYGEDNPPSIMLLEQGCKDPYSKVTVMVDCSKALKNGICQDNACVVKPKIAPTPSNTSKPEIAPKRSFAKRFKDTVVAFFSQLAQSIWSLPPPENPYGCQDSDSNFNSDWYVVNNKTSLKTPGSVTFKGNGSYPESPLNDSCGDNNAPSIIGEATCSVYPDSQHYNFFYDDKNTSSDKGKLFPRIISMNCKDVQKGWGCSEFALDSTKPGTVKKVGAHCVPGINGHPDLDEDGVSDWFDNCPWVPNADQKDSYDHTGSVGSDDSDQGDACGDFDGDGLVDAQDNCPTVSNPDQKNSDKNPAGDVCQDADGDGVLDIVNGVPKDNCPMIANPDQLDFDQNGVGDACDEPSVLTEDKFETPKDFSVAGLVAAGAYHSCALHNGKLFCWGKGDQGELGVCTLPGLEDKDNPSTCYNQPGVNNPTPQEVFSPQNIKYDFVAAGTTHTCSGRFNVASQAIQCFGQNGPGLLGDGSNGIPGATNWYPSLTDPVGIPSGLPEGMSLGSIIKVVTGTDHSCALIKKTPNNEVWCWGDNQFFKSGFLNLDIKGTAGSPQLVKSLQDKQVTDIAVGKDHSCAVANHEVWCWGASSNGQVGNGMLTDSGSMLKKVQLPYAYNNGKASAAAYAFKVVSGDDHTCALFKKGETQGSMTIRLYCWGNNAQSQITETDPTTKISSPKDLTDELINTKTWEKILDVWAGGNSTCTFLQKNDADKWLVSCWGGELYKEAGKQVKKIIDKKAASGLNTNYLKTLSIGLDHTCAIQQEYDPSSNPAGETVYCWGKNDYGQLGTGGSGNGYVEASELTKPKKVLFK